jgi:hypothetical protein
LRQDGGKQSTEYELENCFQSRIVIANNNRGKGETIRDKREKKKTENSWELKASQRRSPQSGDEKKLPSS